MKGRDWTKLPSYVDKVRTLSADRVMCSYPDPAHVREAWEAKTGWLDSRSAILYRKDMGRGVQDRKSK